MKKCLLILPLFFLVACSSESEKIEKSTLIPQLTEVTAIEESHKKREFLSHSDIRFEIEVSFGGKERLAGRVTLATNSSRGLIELRNGNKLIVKEKEVYFSPGMNENKVRFDAYTWSYFFLFPYKLSDEGTIWSASRREGMNGEVFDAQRLTFKGGIGDAPDDWYEVFSDTATHLLQAAAYIVTANKTVEEAEKDPHAIKYSSYIEVNSVPVASKWEFFNWTQELGMQEKLGEAKITQIEFLEAPDSLYLVPANFLKI